MKYKNLVLLVVLAIVILIFIVGIPYFQFRQFQNADFGGSNTFTYISQLMPNLDSEQANTLGNLVDNYGNMLTNTRISLLNMYLYIGIILVIILIIIGIVVLKFAKKRALAITLFCCSVISILQYIFIYITLRA